jgi:hypothetical protein
MTTVRETERGQRPSCRWRVEGWPLSFVSSHPSRSPCALWSDRPRQPMCRLGPGHRRGSPPREVARRAALKDTDDDAPALPRDRRRRAPGDADPIQPPHRLALPPGQLSAGGAAPTCSSKRKGDRAGRGRCGRQGRDLTAPFGPRPARARRRTGLSHTREIG